MKEEARLDSLDELLYDSRNPNLMIREKDGETRVFIFESNKKVLEIHYHAEYISYIAHKYPKTRGTEVLRTKWDGEILGIM